MRGAATMFVLLCVVSMPAQVARPAEPVSPAQRANQLARELELPERRRAAVEQLLRLGTPAVDALLMQARHPYLAVAHVALQTLAELGHDALPAVPKLQQFAAGKDAHARAAAWALARLPHRGTFLVPFMDEGVVRELDAHGKEIWSSGNLGKPWSATRLADDHLLVADVGRGASEYDTSGSLVWEARGDSIYTAERLPDGNTLCADYGRELVIELDLHGNEVWSHKARSMFAHRLPHGGTFLQDFHGFTLFEVAASGAVLWRIEGDICTRTAQLLADGNVLSRGRNLGEAEVRNRTGRQLRNLPTLDQVHAVQLLPDGSIQSGWQYVRRCAADGSELWKVTTRGNVGPVSLR